ncbi:translation initiation factor [Bdellovibrio sp. HCB2-146]|uniref:translation initiation factor n=1 Tax=Bdellovibrio sp. HCB2-146 TaxID=3394362 RepID=UPI0039BD0CE4
MSSTRLVFSTDPKDMIQCPKCKKHKDDCICVPEDAVGENKFTVIFRLEKNGRGGKTVTILDGFPRNEAYLKDLTKELKAKCGTGGTFEIGAKAGMIEIQGDKRDQLKKILELKKIKFKGM